jgi:hydrogenase expression/formation protein HypD
MIPKSGFALAQPFAEFDAERKFPMKLAEVDDPIECISGQVLTGHRRPNQCPSFGTICTPDKPLGATMVSSEGACAAYYRYKRNEVS